MLAMTSRNGTAITATTTTATASRFSHGLTPDPASGSSRASARDSSRATAICSAEPGTARMMKADMSTASEP